MFIKDCVRLAKKYYPSEYDDYEMYLWCNEVTAMLADCTGTAYVPVCLPKYTGCCTVSDNTVTVDLCAFKVGDSINISVNNGETEYREIPVLEIEYSDRRYKLYVPENTFSEDISSENTVITRCITDETYCRPPYDGMYTYYLLAKICLLQHDIEMYNQYMNIFNTLFEQYKRKLSSCGCIKSGTGGRFINWWNNRRGEKA